MKRISKVKVGITFGDPAGVGPEIIYKALIKIKNLAEFFVIGDEWVFEKVKTKKSLPNLKFIDLKNVNRKEFRFGKISLNCAKASLEYIDTAIKLTKKREIDCLVTCPVSKEAISLLGLKFDGHTHYLARKFNLKTTMMLLNQDLKFSLLTEHIPLLKIKKFLTLKNFTRVLLETYKGLRNLFLIKKPKIVVLALNPHASDGGLFGDEEKKLILPLVKKLKSKINSLFGPEPADTAILKLKAKKYDCAVALYHDQALIPLKLTGFKKGVNLTLGLPFVRTSPLHGTAFDIAGKNLACEDSLVEAIKLAVRCTQNQKNL